MTAASPTIVASCAGLVGGEWTDLDYGPLMLHALSLARVSGRRPRVLHVNTAGGDPRSAEGPEIEAAWAVGAEARHLRLFPHPNAPSVASYVLEHDMVWVSGGSVANLAALWRLHGVDRAMRAAWEAGVVIAGGSAGAVIWHQGGTTSSFGPAISAFTGGMGLVPGSLAVHYDSDARRRAAFHRSIAAGELSAGYALDEGTGVVYRGAGSALEVDVLTEREDGHVRRVALEGDAVREHTLRARLLRPPGDQARHAAPHPAVAAQQSESDPDTASGLDPAAAAAAQQPASDLDPAARHHPSTTPITTPSRSRP